MAELKATTYTLNGRISLLESQLKKTPNIAQHLFVYDDLIAKFIAATTNRITTNPGALVNPDTTINTNTTRLLDRKIGWFMVGDGGALYPGTAGGKYLPRNHETVMYAPKPIRMVLKTAYAASPETFANYRLRVPCIFGENEYYAFFAKALTVGDLLLKQGSTPNIDSPNYAPVYADTVALGAQATPGGNLALGLSIFSACTIELSMNDVKEYYQNVDGTLVHGRVTEFGIIIAEDKDMVGGYSELANAELLLKMTSGTYPVENPEAGLSIKTYLNM